TFRKGDGGAFSETDDTYLYNGTPDANFGADPKLYVDNADCIAKATICKVLIKFPQIIGPDPAQIRANSTIASATLDLTVLNAGVKQDLYQVTEAWNESTATWNGFATPGQPTTRAREYTFYPTALGKMSLNLTSIVQRWTNGDSNQGILLASTHWDGVDYGSSESTTKPTLTVAFDPPPSPSAAPSPASPVRLHGVGKPVLELRRGGEFDASERDGDPDLRLAPGHRVRLRRPSGRSDVHLHADDLRPPLLGGPDSGYLIEHVGGIVRRGHPRIGREYLADR